MTEVKLWVARILLVLVGINLAFLFSEIALNVLGLAF